MIKQKFVIINSDLKMANIVPVVKSSGAANSWEFSSQINQGLKNRLLDHLNSKYPDGLDSDDDDAFDSLIPDMNVVCRDYFQEIKAK